MSTPLPTRIGGAVLGTMTFGDTVDEATAARIIDLSANAGVRMIDTANAYAAGRTEEILGRVLTGHEGRFLVATKAGMPHDDAGDAALLSREGIHRSLEGSLRRLGMDKVDLFYLHQPDRSTPVEETLETVGGLLSEGRIGAYGVSNYAAWQVAEMNATADRLGIDRPVVAQQLYNLVARRIENEYAEFARTAGLHTMVYNPLGGGLLVGRHRFEERPDSGRFGDSRLAGMYTERYWNARLFEAIRSLTDIAAGAGISLIELSLRWLLSKPVTDSVLVGGSRPEQISDNLAVIARGPLDDDTVAACDAVGEELHGPMPAYNR
ncbi:aldo/keto reductase [Nocardiopsis ansamitocini]|uniref:Oxidoreductase n=1 Tax=Nocardiopsis ansamitocini TaxID=1670832 RepID=A0A9W6UII5_9ACTN|nr:aldo/keto reductase [Nocardiopsis ansamitocini]GLU47090.1 oxidoreductase [Nocardiopsis ansamitocini]